MAFGTAVAFNPSAVADHQRWSRRKQPFAGGRLNRVREMDKKMNAIQLLEQNLGYDVIDALVQANVDLNSVTLEQAKQLLVRATRERRDSAGEPRVH